MIAPIMDPTGCFGVIYVDNALEQQPYTLSDLDYLMMLAIHTAAILENF
jgi:GAF domain-containing protein